MNIRYIFIFSFSYRNKVYTKSYTPTLIQIKLIKEEQDTIEIRKIVFFQPYTSPTLVLHFFKSPTLY
jgi:hypothetical protein